jgi:PAS domain S-box-containing protein
MLALAGLVLAVYRPATSVATVWPPAGLGVALLVAHGRTAAGWVWAVHFALLLGAFLAREYGPEAGVLAALPWQVWLATVHTAQAGLAAGLVRRRLGPDPPLLTGRSVVEFLLIAGPAAAAAGATLAVGAGWVVGLAPAADLPAAWWWWWLSGAISGAAFAPVGLALAGRPAAVWRPRRWTVAVPLLLVTAAVLAGCQLARRADDAAAARELDAQLLVAGLMIEDMIDTSAKAVRSAEFTTANGASRLADAAERDKVREHLGSFRQLVPELANVVLAVPVPAARRAEFERTVAPILEPAGGGVRPAGDRPEYLSAVVGASWTPPFPLVGLDLLADPVRREVMERTRRTGRPAATGPVDFLTGAEPLRGLIVATRTGDAVSPTFAALLFRTDLLLASGGRLVDRGVRLELAPADRPPPAGATTRPVRVADREWAVHAVPDAAFAAAYRGDLERVVGPVGFGLVLLLAALLLVVSGQTGLVADEVAARTRELEGEARAHRVTAAWLRASEARLVIAQRIAGLGYWEWRPGEPLWSDDLARVLDAAGPDDLLGWVHPDDRPALDQLLADDDLMSSRRSGPFGRRQVQVRVRRPAGDARVLLVTRDFTANPADGTVRGAAQDVSGQRAVERALVEQGERLRVALDAAAMGTWEWEFGTDAVAWDARTADLFGTTLADFDGRLDSVLARVHPDDRAGGDQARAAVVAGRADYAREFRVVLPGGGVRWLAARGRVVPAGGGRPARLVGVNFDITARKAADEAVRLSEERLRAVLEHSADTVTVLDASGRQTFISGGAITQNGYAPDELLGKPPLDQVHPDDRPAAAAALARVLAEPEAVVRAEYRYRRKDGSYAVLAAVAVNRLNDPAVGGILINTRDVTELRAQADELARKTRLKRAILDAFPGHVSAQGRDGRLLLLNRGLADRFGTTPEAAAGRPLTDFVPADHAAAAADRADWVMATGKPLGYDARTPDGVWWRTVKAPLPGPDGRAVGVVTVSVDVTAVKAAEEVARDRAAVDALRAEVGLAVGGDAPVPATLVAAAEAVRRFADAAFVRVWTLDPAGRVLELQASVGLYTHTDGRHGRFPVGQLMVGRIAATLRPLVTNAVATDPHVGDPAWAAREGLVAFAGLPLVCDGRAVGVLALFARHELTPAVVAALGGVADAVAVGVARKQAEVAVRASEAALAEAQRVARLGSWELDLQTDDLRCSAVARELYGFPPAGRLTGAALQAGLEATAQDAVGAAHHSPGADGRAEYEYRYTRPDGAVRHLLVKARVGVDPATARATVYGTTQDVTDARRAEADRRRLTEAVQQTQRLDALGTLAGGIAHEFNNLLTGVLGNATLARELLPAGSELHDFLAPIEEASHRAAGLCQQLLGYTGRGATSWEVTDLGRLVLDSAELVRVAAGRRTAVTFDAPDGLPAVVLDPTQVRQAILGLVQNAAEAAGPGGRIRVRVGQADGPPAVDPDETWSGPPPAGPHLWLEVADDGPGMAAAVRGRAFEPFFTTRAAGRGLGLSGVHGVARRHAGAVRLVSRPGGGTAARVCLPVDQPADTEPDAEPLTVPTIPAGSP